MKPRGIIMTPSHRSAGGEETFGGNSIDPLFLRQCVLYWDTIDCPDSVIGGVTLSPNETDLLPLEQEGIFQRTRGHFVKKVDEQYILSFVAEHPQEFWTMAQLYAFEKHKDDDVQWTIGQPFQHISLPDPTISSFYFIEPGHGEPARALYGPSELVYSPNQHLEFGPALEVQLYHGVPVPLADVPIAEILELKQKRADELARYRHAMDGLYLRMIDSQEILRARDYCIDEVDKAVTDLCKVMHESRIRRFLSSVSLKLSLPQMEKVMVAAAAGAVLVSQFDLPELTTFAGAVGTAVMSSIKMSMDPMALKPKRIPGEYKDYAYLFHVRDEFGKD